MSQRDREIHVVSEHADVDAIGQTHVPYRHHSKDCGTVAVFVIHKRGQSPLRSFAHEPVSAWAKDFLGVDVHLFRRLIKKVRANKESVFVDLQFETTPVDDQLGTMTGTGLYRPFNIEPVHRHHNGRPESTSTLRCIRHG